MSGGGRTEHRALPVILLAVVFLAVHGVLAAVDLVNGVGEPMGDVTGAYRFWIDYWHQTGVLVGVDTPWVYPIVALVPMLAASVLGDGPYGLVWLLLVTVLDGVALVFVARRSMRLAWWWVAVTACIGPVALARIDSIATPIAVLGVLVIASRPLLASVLFTVATWIKVWPAALLAALVLAGRRVATVVTGAAITSAAVIGVAVALGARANVFSFVTAQTGRGLQIEAPITSLWLWDVAAGRPGATIYYDRTILTYQVTGTGVAQTAAAMTAVLAIGVLAVCGAGLFARLRGAPQADVIALTALGFVSAVVALNKVGSPQYLTWFVAPVLLGLATTNRFRFPAVLVLVLAVLTQAIYPWFYDWVTSAAPWALVLLDVRNLLEVVLLAWTLGALLKSAPERGTDLEPATVREPDVVAGR